MNIVSCAIQQICCGGVGIFHVAGGILVPRPGIKPMSPALEAQSPNHWTTREVPVNPSCLSVFYMVVCICESHTPNLSLLHHLSSTHQRIDAFELWCWRRHLRVPWTTRRSNQSILKEISPIYSLEGLMRKLKLQYFGHLMRKANSLEKTLMLGERSKAEGERRGRQDEMIGWHHRLNGHEFEQALGDGEGPGSLVCCSPWSCKELDTT